MVASTKFDFAEYLKERRELVQHKLAQFLAGDDPDTLWESMRYSVLSGGKRLRALLCLSTAEAIGGSQAIELALPCACAIECVHAFSLIHDDLPAMDDDDFRRGRPTNHKVYGEDMAILAGDALFALAFEILIKRTPAVPADVLLSVAGELARSSGGDGMVGGQVADLRLTGSTNAGAIPLANVETMHRRKTGALIKFSAWAGARLSGAGETQLAAVSQYGDILGLAFQIADDLLDETGDIKTLGKTPGKDAASGKATWVRAFGQEQAKERLQQLEAEGMQVLSALATGGEATRALECLLEFAIHRKH